MNMFKNAGADNVDDYLKLVKEDHVKTINFLHDFIQRIAPELEVFYAYNMLGYGKFKYTNYKKEEVEWPIIAMASQKNYMSIYVCAINHDKGGLYLAEQFKDELGKVSIGKSCIRFKKLEDLNLKTLEKVLRLAVKSPGIN